MKSPWLMSCCALTLFPLDAYAAAQCASGFQPRGDICVSQRMSDFIACVEASGGNKSQLYDQIATSINSGGGGKAQGTASGVIIQGGGSVEVDKNSEERLNSTLSSQYYGRAMDVCRQALADIAPTATTPIEPPAAAPPPPVTVTYKICSGEYERACQLHDVYLYCYSDVNAWAAQRCTSSTVSRYNTYGGNKCGYGMDLVTCVGPR
jgi:hypothetical protein